MALNVYLNFDGNCHEVVEYYKEVFETEEPKYMLFSDMAENPEYPLPEDAKNRIMHTYINVCGGTIMFSDTFPGMPYTIGNNVTLAIISDDKEKITKYFNKLKDGGNVQMELMQTEWSELYGSLTDKFGIIWQFSHQV